MTTVSGVSNRSVLSGPSPTALTAEGLMFYLQTRLTGLDDQINAVFDKQKRIEAIRKELGKFQAALAGLKEENGPHYEFKHPQASAADVMAWSDGKIPDKVPAVAMADYERVMMEALVALKSLDKELATELGKVLWNDNVTMIGGLNGSYKGEEVKRLKEVVNNYTKQLESSAQMEMIGLQSLMSNRQTAIQLSTNLISSLNKSTEQIVANVGR
jgi:hypothetical protein